MLAAGNKRSFKDGRKEKARITKIKKFLLKQEAIQARQEMLNQEMDNIKEYVAQEFF